MPKRHDNRGRSKNPEGQYLALPYATARHAAFRALSGAALKVYIELRCRYTVKGDGRFDNNGELFLSLDEAARLLGLGKATVQRAYAELEAAGFIAMTERGHWYGRKATTWRVTDRPYKGQPASRDWQQPSVPKK